ncbi:SUMF1/EgtB/PvdO family nonheme iron enzyme [Cupriavidus basilensis]|uniref:SUMF1/EgtB/PvdO family nonheme iron enzyme n=1 Tax=Cupriavidus basilensis TaxID=68895 RepID=UPI0028507C0B|nr:SUMF1/EgtB/PvdO family nonheme iron enzyme [Cupriavidus basilensis]MDR3385397.1 SUMF1/EgtB/PvdO family nonheme iron enzyme [Cupriavidus basilensis]
MWRKFLVVCLLGLAAAVRAEAGIDTPALPPQTTMHPAAAPASAPGRRLALVIGNAAYVDEPLPNAANDARAMRRTLAALGFDVMFRENLDREGMARALAEFQQRLQAGGTGLFYFAGHGIEVADSPVMIPVDAGSHAPGRLLTAGTALDAVLASMSAPRPDMLNVVILDSCLDNPYRGSAVKPPDAPANTLVAYATAPGAVAAEGARHGAFTGALLRTMRMPGLDAEAALRRAGELVSQQTGQRQQPWISSSLSAPLRFAANAGATTGRDNINHDDAAFTHAHGQADPLILAQHRGILPKDSDEQYELSFWDSIKNSNFASDYEAYLKAYPNGRFAPLARARIERLRAAGPQAGAPAERARTPGASSGQATAQGTVTPPPARAKSGKGQVPPAAPSATTPAASAPPGPAASAPSPATQRAAAAGAVTVEIKPGEIKDCPACPVLHSLPAGSFTMGSNGGDPTEKPPHHVAIGQPFAIGKYEVTVEQWGACADAGACQRIATVANAPRSAPVRDVSWDDAQQYVAWLSKVSGKHYRLPTEAEWEYAARGGTTTLYWWGDQMRKGTANCKDCGEPWNADAPANVGSFAANGYGLHDMNGSVWEWVADCWHVTYKNAPADGRAWDEPGCGVRVIRGGSWHEGASYMLSSTRFKYSASVRQSQNGFRVVRDLK